MSDREINRLHKSDEKLRLHHVKWAESHKFFYEQGIVVNLKVSSRNFTNKQLSVYG